MKRRVITTAECDSFDEVLKLAQTLFDNQFLMEDRIEKLENKGKRAPPTEAELAAKTKAKADKEAEKTAAKQAKEKEKADKATAKDAEKKAKLAKKTAATKAVKKGMVSMKTLLTTVVLVLCFGILAFATVDITQIDFPTVTSGTFDQSLRGWFDTLNQDIVLSGGTLGLRSGGTVYYVDGNKSTAGTGTGGWDNAFNTLSAAMAASHANIAVSARRAWASRNTIYVRADGITEDLTTLAQKTDIIGVGSDDAFEKALITGTWAIPDTTGYPGCHFYNMLFQDDGAGGALWDVDTQSGLEFHSCWFRPNATDTIGLQVEECQNLVVDRCFFGEQGTNGDFTASAIKVVDDTDAVWNYRITNNIIYSDAIGIDWDETGSEGNLIAYNFMYTVGIGIDEEGDKVFCIGNRMVTAVDTGTYTAGFDFSEARAIDNIITGSGGETDIVPNPEATAN